MKRYCFIILLLLTYALGYTQEPKVVSDCTATFSITSNKAATNNNLAGAVKTLYVKGNVIRVEVTSSAFTQSVIYNNASGDAVLLKEMGNDKFIKKIDAEGFKQQNSNYEGMKISYTGETKTILGYDCKKGTATLKNSSVFTFYYTTSLKLSATENPYQFKDIPGFVLEYEIAGDDKTSKITYTATRVNFNPVPASKFDIPTTGYRTLN